MNRVLVLVYVLAVLVFSAILGRDLIDYRVSELNFLLEQAAEIQESADTLSIVGKYELIRRRIERGESALSNYSLEARTVALSAESILSGMDLQQPQTLLPVGLFLRPIHFVMGKTTFNPSGVGQQANLIEIAYYWERNRDYDRAIQSYDVALSTRMYSKPDVVAAILLHQGFCHSMLNQYTEARVCFQEAIERYPETDAGILAWKLIEFLDSLEAQRRLVQSGELTAFEAGRQAYFLMDFRRSILYLDQYLGETGEEGYVAEARYFKARSHEELGEVDEALTEYEALIGQQENRRWAMEAGRRVYMLGVYYGQQERISEESRTQVVALRDSAFLEAVNLFAGPESAAFAPAVAAATGAAGETAQGIAAEDYAGEAAMEAETRTVASGNGLESSAGVLEPPLQESDDPLERLVRLLEPQRVDEATVSPAPTLGGLEIENMEADLVAYLDGWPLGRVGQGPFQSIEPGEYRLELRGDGRKQPERFGAAVVSIAAGENALVFVEPIPYGGIEYRIPDGATAIVEGSDTRIPVTGEGTLRFLPVGMYRIEVAFPGYPSSQQRISVNLDQTVDFFPTVPFDAGSGVMIAGRQATEEGLPPADSPLPSMGIEGTKSAVISPALMTSEQRNREVRITQLSAERTALTEKIEKVQRRRKTVTRGQWISYGTGLAALGGMGASLYLGSQSYKDYQAAIYTDDAVELRERTQLLQGMAITSGILGGLGIAGGTVLLAINPDLERLQRRIDLVDAEIGRLRGESE